MAAAALLAQAAADADPTERIVKVALLLIGILLVAFVIVGQVKRRLRRADEEASMSAGAGFTLSDLRRMHKSGQMSDEEFEKAKAKIIDAARKVADRQAGVASLRGGAPVATRVETKPADADGGQTGT